MGVAEVAAPRLEKAPQAYRTISEVSQDLDLPQHVLRFWETRFGKVKPLKRGGGRRYYRPDDVALLKGIRELLYGRGYTIKGVQRILREEGPRSVQAIGRGEAPRLRRPEAGDIEGVLDDEAGGGEVADGVPGGPEHHPEDRNGDRAHVLVVREVGDLEMRASDGDSREAPLPAASPALGADAAERLLGLLEDLAEARRLIAKARELSGAGEPSP